MEKITKEELFNILQSIENGKQNITWLKDKIGDEVVSFIQKRISGKLNIDGPWKNGQDGQHYLEINMANGVVNHECMIATVEKDLCLAGHKYEKEYEIAILKGVKDTLLKYKKI